MSKIKGKIKALGNKVLVHNMNFGEQKTASGIVLTSDNGKERGIYARWGQVFAVGPEHSEDYGVGDWILVEHGRWTRGIDLELEDGTTTTIRMVENKSVLLWDSKAPEDFYIGHESDLTMSSSVRPEDFV